jgi:hypothetical protein
MYLSVLTSVHIHNEPPICVHKLSLIYIYIYMLLLLLHIFQEWTEHTSYKIYYNFYRLS